MPMELNRREFFRAGALVAAVAGAFPWSRALAEGSKKSTSAVPATAFQDGKYWVAELGLINEFNGAEPCYLHAKFKNEKDELMDEEKLYVRWEQTGRMHTEGHAIVISAICTHLKCKVEYKGDEGIFRCPCHKSEFELDGTVTKKPAKKNLPDYSDLVYIPTDSETLYLRRKVKK